MEDQYENKMFSKYPDAVNVYDLCAMLGGISIKLAYRLLRENIIPSIRIGREYRIAKIDVIGYLKRK